MPLDLKVTSNSRNDLWDGSLDPAGSLQHPQREVRILKFDSLARISIPASFEGDKFVQSAHDSVSPKTNRIRDADPGSWIEWDDVARL